MRLVRRTIEVCFEGTIQRLVPVYPRCPNASVGKNWPVDVYPSRETVSQPPRWP
jgi:hypothetical protein